MPGIEIIDLTPENIAEYGVCGYNDIEKHLELRRKIEWFREYYPKGLRIKAILITGGDYQGMLEDIPGKYAHRPVDADCYMFITTRQTPCAFGTFCIVHNGEVVSQTSDK